MDGFHNLYAESVGVDQNSTDIAHEVAYRGHEENGEFEIEEESEENKRLLSALSGRGLSQDYKRKLFRKVGEAVQV